jgi:hypothetical protein
MQSWPLSRFQNILLETRKKLNQIEKRLFDLQNNPISIGFIFTQILLVVLINQNLILFGQELSGETSLQNMPDYSLGQKEGIEPISGNRKVITHQSLY